MFHSSFHTKSMARRPLAEMWKKSSDLSGAFCAFLKCKIKAN